MRRIGRRPTTLVAVVSMVGLVAAGIPSVAVGSTVEAVAATQVACGDVLTSDVTLSTDLVCSGELGLEVRGVATVNLNRHRLIGPGSGVGVRLVGPESVLTLVNGTVTGWNTGLIGDSSDYQHLVVKNVTFTEDTNGVVVDNSLTAAIDRSTFLANETGILQIYAPGTVVTRSLFSNNDTAISSGSSSQLSISRTTISDNRLGVWCFDGSCANISSSKLKGNGTALSVLWDGGVVRDTKFIGNGIGADLGSSTYVEFDADVFRGNSVGIESRADWMGLRNVHDSIFRRNGIGFRTDAVSPQSTLENNTFRRNKDGIYFEVGPGMGPSLGGNTAVRNSGWGIFAVGATDLGGNVAYRNGNEPQCVGVTC